MNSFKEMFLVLCMMVFAGLAGFGVYKYIIAPQSEINIIEIDSSADKNNPTHNKPLNNLIDLSTLVVNDVDANPIALDQWQGKVLAINFWATWCAPCRKEIPLLIQTQNKYQSKNVQFLGIAMDETKAVNNYMQTAGFNYPILISDLNQTVKIGQAVDYNFVALPFTVFISADGKRSQAHTGELKKEQLEEVLNSLL